MWAIFGKILVVFCVLRFALAHHVLTAFRTPNLTVALWSKFAPQPMTGGAVPDAGNGFSHTLKAFGTVSHPFATSS